MKILHLASFRGNIGDNISHVGLGSIISRSVSHFSIDCVEIRRYYQNYKGNDKGQFDETFIELINQYDMAIMGGGGFLEFHLPHSQTGTTFDIDPDLIAGIRTPTLMSSLGCAIKTSIPDGNVGKFKRFVDALLDNQNIHIAIRNDGSYQNLLDIDARYGDHVPEILDNGFFFKPDTLSNQMLTSGAYVAVNIPSDQLRMSQGLGSVGDEEKFFNSLSEGLKYLVENQGLNLVFVPHVHFDLEAISRVLSMLPDSLVRNHVLVAPCVQGVDAAFHQSRIYRDAQLIMAGRLHANVCAMVSTVPVIGLSLLDRVRYLFTSVGLGEWVLTVEGDFSDKLIAMAERALRLRSFGSLSDRAEYRFFEDKSLQFYQKAFESR